MPENIKHLYNYLTKFKGFEGKPVCKIGIWSKYYDNGQLHWQLDYGDGKHDSNVPKKQFKTHYLEDGTPFTIS